MPGATARLALPYPVLGDAADVPHDVQALATALDTALLWSSGTFAGRPAASLAGKVYYATDLAKTYVDTGATWVAIANNIATADIAANAVTDAKQASGTFTPIGSVVDYGGASAPTNWQLCDGTAISRTTYATLFGLLSTNYGAGDGSTTFNVPDLRGRTVVGAGGGPGLTARFRGSPGGEETHVLIVPEMPSHTHSVLDIQAGGFIQSGTGYTTTGLIGTTATGGGGAHNNMQPFQVLNKIIRIL